MSPIPIFSSSQLTRLVLIHVFRYSRLYPFFVRSYIQVHKYWIWAVVNECSVRGRVVDLRLLVLPDTGVVPVKWSPDVVEGGEDNGRRTGPVPAVHWQTQIGGGRQPFIRLASLQVRPFKRLGTVYRRFL